MNINARLSAVARRVALCAMLTGATMSLGAMSVATAGEVINNENYNSESFRNIEYTWVDARGELRTSNLAEPATEPEQIKAFIAAIYSDPNIPGSKDVKYFDKDGRLQTYAAPDGRKHTVQYPPVAAFGVTEDVTPYEHGVTAILVELNIPEECAYPNPNALSVAQWINRLVPGFDAHKNSMDDVIFSGLFKSMQVLTERQYLPSASNPGYVFNIDKPLKHFFVVLKGKPRQENNYMPSEIFEQFEQISPTVSSAVTDVPPTSTLASLLMGDRYQVYHDCSSVLLQDHYFCMNRVEGVGDFEADENLYFFIPEARMTAWSATDPDIIASGAHIPSSGRDQNGLYTWYNPSYAPYVFAYNIALRVAGVRHDEEHHDVTLTWRSNFADLTKSNDTAVVEDFYIYRVDENGVVANEPIRYDENAFVMPEGTSTRVVKDEDGYMLVKSVDPEVSVMLREMHHFSDDSSRPVQYLVSGRISGTHFDPVYSNTASYMMFSSHLKVAGELDMTRTTSHFDPVTMSNNYHNVVNLLQISGTDRGIESSDLVEGSTFTLIRRAETPVASAPSYRPLKAKLGAKVKEEETGRLVILSKTLDVEASRYEYVWQLECPGQDPIVGRFFSDYTGDEATDCAAIVQPEDESGVYASFVDVFTEDISENAHPAAYSYYFAFDPNGATLPDGTEITSAESNEVNRAIPNSVVSLGLASFSRRQVEDDTRRTLSPAGLQVSLDVSNTPTIASYEVKRVGDNATVARVRRTSTGNFSVATVDNNGVETYTREVVTSEFSEDGRANVAIQLPESAGEVGEVYATIVSTYGNEYGVPSASAPMQPNLTIENLEVMKVSDPGYNNGRHFVSVKRLVPHLEVPGYDISYAHYNVWRHVDHPGYSGIPGAEILGNGEELIRNHDSDAWVDKGINRFPSFNAYENFVATPGGVDGEMTYRDGFSLDTSAASAFDAKVTYTVRLYATLTPSEDDDYTRATMAKTASLASAETASFDNRRYIMVEATAGGKFEGGVTGVESILGDLATDGGNALSVEIVGNGSIRVDGSGPIRIVNLAGVTLATPASGSVVTIAPGIYIVTNGVESRKVAL